MVMKCLKFRFRHFSPMGLPGVVSGVYHRQLHPIMMRAGNACMWVQAEKALAMTEVTAEAIRAPVALARARSGWSGTVGPMCDDHEHSAAEAAWSAPRLAEGPAVDPVALPAVDEVTVTTMIDNTFD